MNQRKTWIMSASTLPSNPFSATRQSAAEGAVANSQTRPVRSSADESSPSELTTENARSPHLDRGYKEEKRRVATKAFFLRDTKAWAIQVWISFGISLFLCAVGLAYLPGADLDRAFMVMGYFFCLSTAFVLSKFVRDNAQRKSDTPLFGAVVYVAFAAAIALTSWGLYRMAIPESYKAYLLVSWLYLITTTFTLAKTLRDRHEIEVLEARETRSE